MSAVNIQDQAQEKVIVGNETLTIQSVYVRLHHSDLQNLNVISLSRYGKTRCPELLWTTKIARD
jgi:hypothetical protein